MLYIAITLLIMAFKMCLKQISENGKQSPDVDENESLFKRGKMSICLGRGGGGEESSVSEINVKETALDSLR